MTRRSWRGLVPVVALALLVACSGDDASTGDTAPTTTAAAAGEALRLGSHDAVRIELLGGPDWLAADESFLYVKLDGGRVDRIDPATGTDVASAQISGEGGLSGSGCQGIGIGFDSVWTCHGTDVVRLGLDPFEEVARIDAGKAASQGHLSTGFGRVWVLQGDGSTLAGIDPRTDAVGAPIALPVRGTDLAAGSNGIWIVSALDDAVVVIDPTSGSVLHRIDGINGPMVLSAAEDVMWVGGATAVHRIDQATATIQATVDGGIGRDGAIAADEAGAWVRRGNEVHHIAGRSGPADEDAFGLDLAAPSPGDMLVAFGALWTTASEDAALFRIQLDGQ
jgi:hypothetical protein